MNFEKLFNEYEILVKLFFKKKSKKEIKEKSQYFTPINIVDKMLNGIKISKKNKIKILDPSCGGGILIFKLLEKIYQVYEPTMIEIDLFDIDKNALEIVKTLSQYLDKTKIKVNLVLGDFLESQNITKYDYIIMNPPYKKTNIISLADNFKKFINGQPNLYHLFIGSCLEKLKKDGILVIISPKNYLGGKYTENLRKILFNEFSILKIHTFNERSKLFDNKIVQEVCILHISKESKNLINISYNEEKSFNKSIKDLILCKEKNILMTPRNDNDISIVKLFNKFSKFNTGKEILMKIGKVVQFRVKEEFLKEKEYSYYDSGKPLIVYRHINKGFFDYRELLEKKQNKAITLIENLKTYKLLIDNKNYIFLKKNIDKSCSKLILPVLYLKDLKTDKIAIDNNLIYITKKDGDFSLEEILGIFCILNSNQFDLYYRVINNSHTVNIYELEVMNFPNLELIKKIGEKCINKNLTIEYCSNIIEQYL